MILQVEIHIMAEQEALANYHINWDATMRELFDYQGGGIWYSSGRYEVGFDEEAAKYLQKFADERMEEYGITEFYTEIKEIQE